MKKIPFSNSQSLMTMIALLVELGVVDIDSVIEVSIDLLDTTIMKEMDYLAMVTALMPDED